MERTQTVQTENASEDNCQNRRVRFVATLERLLPLLRSRSRRIVAVYRTPGLDPDDLVQEVLLVALVKMESLRLPADRSLLGFLEICMRNRARDESKKRAHLAGQSLNEDLLQSLEPTPLGAIIHLEAARELREAWTRLGSVDRALVAGRVLERMDFLELSRATRRASADAARVAFARAKAKLRRLVFECKESRTS